MPEADPEAGLRLLIVDGTDATRLRIARIARGGELEGLALLGTARTRPEAVRLARDIRPQVATVDVTSPALGGTLCIAELLAAVPRLAVVAIGALSDKAHAADALRLGARAFVAKPYSDEELGAALADAAQRPAPTVPQAVRPAPAAGPDRARSPAG